MFSTEITAGIYYIIFYQLFNIKYNKIPRLSEHKKGAVDRNCTWVLSGERNILLSSQFVTVFVFFRCKAIVSVLY